MCMNIHSVLNNIFPHLVFARESSEDDLSIKITDAISRIEDVIHLEIKIPVNVKKL